MTELRTLLDRETERHAVPPSALRTIHTRAIRRARRRRAGAITVLLALGLAGSVGLLRLAGPRGPVDRPASTLPSSPLPVTGRFEATYVPEGFRIFRQKREPVWAPIPPGAKPEKLPSGEVGIPATPVPGRWIYRQTFGRPGESRGRIDVLVIKGPPIVSVEKKLTRNERAEPLTLDDGTRAVLVPPRVQDGHTLVLWPLGGFSVQVVASEVPMREIVAVVNGIVVR